jgi:site-specific DNA recombinase
MKKVAIYARVSSDKQAEEKTVHSQLADLREICKGFQVVEEYTDEGWSGERLDRPALDRLRDDASKGMFEALYIHSPDRLARKYAYQALVLEELQKHGIEVHFLNKAVSDDPEDQLLLGVQGLIAEYEKAKILERTRRGRLYKAKSKGIVGGYAPYGYRYIKKSADSDERYEAHPQEAMVVRLIFELYLNLKSINSVRKELNQRGVRPQRSRANWCRTSVGAILGNETYTGAGYYGRRQSIEKEGGQRYRKKLKNGVRIRDRSEWIPIKFPPIISEETFRMAQAIRAKNYRPYAHTRHFYLLSGLIRCSRCSSTFTGETRRNQRGQSYGYYRCNNRHKPNPKVVCNAPYVHTQEFDEAIWDAVAGAVTNPTVLIDHILRLAGSLEGSGEKLEEKKALLLKEIQGLEAKKNRLVDLYTSGQISRELFTSKMEEYARSEQALRDEVAEIDSVLSQEIDREAVIQNVEAFCRMACERMRSFTPQERRQFLWGLLEKIVWNGWERKATVIGHVPVAEQVAGGAGCGTKDIASPSYVRCPALRFEIEIGVGTPGGHS